MATPEKDLFALTKFLEIKKIKCSVDKKTKIPQLKNGGKFVSGLTTIAVHLARSCGRIELVGGNSHRSQAAVRQWLEYRVQMIDRCLGDKDVSTVLKELNTFLVSRVYFVDNQLTLADLVIYFGLYHIYAKLSYQDKEKFLNLSRWFNNVQNQAGVADVYSSLPFSLNHLYTSITLHKQF